MKRPNALLFLFLLAVCLVLIPAMAWAQTSEPEPAAAVEILDWLVMMATIVALGAAGWVARRAAAWVKVKTGLETEVLLLSLSESAVSLAEEKAHRAAKVAGNKLSSSDKLDIALDFARDRAKDMGLDKRAEAKLRQYVDAKLGASRVPAEPGPLPVTLAGPVG